MSDFELANSQIGLIVVAGGLGTRSADPSLPKILQEIAPGVTLLDLHLEQSNFFSEIHLLLGHGAEIVENWLALKYPNLADKIFCHIERTPMGSGGAIREVAWQNYDAKRYHVVFGDILTSCSYQELNDMWEQSKSCAYIVGHPNLHPWDSDRLKLYTSQLVEEIVPKKSQKSTHNLAVAGIFGFEKVVLLSLPTEVKDLTNDFLPSLVSKGILGLNSRSYFRDVGTPERLAEGRRDYQTGTFRRRSTRNASAVFLDRDNTLLPDLAAGRTATSMSEFDPGLLKLIRECNMHGVPIYLVTNQPAIAKGFITIAEVETSLIEIENLLASEGMFFDDIAYCPHHPESGFPGEIKELKIICSCRKPALGMFYDISAKHGINLSKSIYIGDSPTDREVAKKLDGTFILWKYLDESNNDIELLNAVELL